MKPDWIFTTRPVDIERIPANVEQRARIVRMREVEKKSWRAIARECGISFQRVCQLYHLTKKQGVENDISKLKIVRSHKKTKNRGVEEIKVSKLTPESLDALLDTRYAEDKIKLKTRRNRE